MGQQTKTATWEFICVKCGIARYNTIENCQSCGADSHHIYVRSRRPAQGAGAPKTTGGTYVG